jgi:hypothetical protein
MSNLNRLESTISGFIPGGLSHGSRRELDDDDDAGSGHAQGNASYQQQPSGYHGQQGHGQGGHGY